MKKNAIVHLNLQHLSLDLTKHQGSTKTSEI